MPANLSSVISNLTSSMLRALKFIIYPYHRYRLSRGIFFYRIYRQSGELKDIDRAIKELLNAVQLAPTDRYAPFWDLGTAFMHRFLLVGEPKDADDAIKHTLKRIQLAPVGHRIIPACLNNLGIIYSNRFTLGGVRGDIDEAITQHLQAVRLTRDDDSNLPTYLHNLGIARLHRFKRFNELTDVNKAIKGLRRAAELTSSRCPDLLDTLGFSYQKRYEKLGKLVDVDKAIAQHLKSVQLSSPDHPEWPSRLDNLGASFMRRFKHLGEQADADKAIERLREVVRLTRGSSNFPMHVGHLGTLFCNRFERFGKQDDIDEAIKLQDEAVQLTHPSDPNLPTRLSNVGLSFCRRFERFGVLEDLNRAFYSLREAVRLSPLELLTLAHAFVTRFRRFGQRKDINEAIKLLQLTLLEHPKSPTHFNNLGIAFSARFTQFGRTRDVRKAIILLRKAVKHAQPHSRMHSTCLYDLGLVFSYRFMRLGKILDIDKAIKYQLEAIQLAPLDDYNLSKHLSGLASSLSFRFWRFGKLKDIDDSIKRAEEAIERVSSDSYELPVYLNVFAISSSYRFKRLGDKEDISKAIERQREAVARTPRGSPNLPACHSTLGRLFFLRSMPGDLDEAIDHQLKATELVPSDSPLLSMCKTLLAISFTSRFEQSGKLDDIDKAIEYTRGSIQATATDNVHLPGHLHDLGELLLLRSCKTEDPKNRDRDRDEAVLNFTQASRCSNCLPLSRYGALFSLAGVKHHAGDLLPALEAYILAITTLRDVMWIGLGAPGQLAQLPSNSHELTCDAAACAIELADHYPQKRQQYLERAIDLLEQGRSVMWSQASNLRADLKLLREHDSKSADKLEQQGNQLAEAVFRDFDQSPLTEPEQQAYRRTAEEHSKLVEKIQKESGIDRFFLPPPFAELQKAATEGHIIIINISSYRCDAVIMQNGRELELVSLSRITEDRVNQLADDYERTRSNNVLHQLWSLVGEPITRRLALRVVEHLPRVWWYLTGSLTCLPIHACFPKRSGGRKDPLLGMMDLAVSSYVTTLSSLLRVPSFKHPSPFHMLAVAHPDAIGDTEPLEHAADEIEDLQCLVASKAQEISTLMNHEATINSVTNALEKCTWAHFALHAVQDADLPMDSGFLLHDGCFKLSRIAQLPSRGAKAAFLSACESAKGSRLMPNESVHIAAGLQFVGFCSVVATMWEIVDADAMFVVAQFYQYLFRNGTPNASEAARALHQAVGQLRKEKQVPDDQWAPFVHFGI